MSKIASDSRGCFVFVGRFGVLALFCLTATFSSKCFAELDRPTAVDRQVTLLVSGLLKQEHLSKHRLDDEISNRALKAFLRTLDPMKVYFLQSDVDEFSKSRGQLDDFVKSGNIKFAYTVFNRFMERVDERVAEVDGLLAQEHDFTRDESLITDPDEIEFVADVNEARDRWRKRIKYELLVRKANAIEQAKENEKKRADGEDDIKDPPTIEEIKEKIGRRYSNFAKIRHQTDSDELLEMFLTSVTSSFDPHTTYMSPSSLENFHINMKLNLEGIGAALQMDDGYTVVTKVIPGGAADKAGQLKAEDRIVSVGEGSEGEMTDVIDMKLGDVVKLIRGRKGTIVRLGVMPEGSTETKEYRITRARIELRDSEARGDIIEEGKNRDGSPTRIGVIDLPSFYMDMNAARQGRRNFKSTTRDVRRLLEDFKSKNVDVVVLDLRQNGGGSLTEAINLTGLFIDQGPVVQVKDSGGRVQHYDDMERGMAWSGPLVVLTSKFSASASEILAGEGQMGQAAYSASKGGVVGMTLPIARDLASVGIRCNTIVPGLIHTPMFDALPQEAIDSLSASVLNPRRLGAPSEIAKTAQYLVENDYVNGECIRVDGGIRMQPR